MAFGKNRRAQKESRVFCSVVVVAAGSSQRMGTDKMFIPIMGIPVLARSLMAVQACTLVDEIIVVTRDESVITAARLCRDYGITKASKVLVGGQSRTRSCLAGVSECNERAGIIAIHDGARPLVTPDIVAGAIKGAKLNLAAAPGIPVKDTVKVNSGGKAVSSDSRDLLVAIQTPQAFESALIKAALTNVLEKGHAVTDDCGAVELLGVNSHICPGSEENIKITTPLDLRLAEAILMTREEDECV